MTTDKAYTPAMVRISKALEMLGISRPTFYRRVDAGVFSIIKRGGCSYVPTDQIEAYLCPNE